MRPVCQQNVLKYKTSWNIPLNIWNKYLLKYENVNTNKKIVSILKKQVTRIIHDNIKYRLLKWEYMRKNKFFFLPFAIGQENQLNLRINS